MWVMNSANIYKGHYHILGGTLSSNENYEQKNLLIDSLVKRIKKTILKKLSSLPVLQLKGRQQLITLKILLKWQFKNN